MTYCPASPVTDTTAKGDPSLTVTLVTVNGRSSLGNRFAFTANTTGVVGAVTVVKVIPVGLLEVNTSPVPSSLIVTVAGVAGVPPVLVAVKLNDSLFSKVPSCSGASNTRTNILPLLSS